MPNLDHFGFLAPFYDRLIKPKSPEKLWKFLELPTGGLLLDAGGGTGRLAQFMLEKSAGVVLADLSFEMLQEAKEKAKFLRICSHTEGFPFSDGSFSRIMMVDALHHVCDQSDTALELWRVLEPGGLLVIEEPDLNKFGVKLIAIAEKFALMQNHFLAPSEISGLFSFPNSEVRIEVEEDGFNAWVIVKKLMDDF